VTVLVRPIEAADIPAVVAMVHELASYERAPEQCQLNSEQLSAALFAPAPALFGHVAELGTALPGSRLGGFALWFLNFSTWRGVHGIYLEDLYVSPRARGVGVGRALMATLAGICIDRGYQRLEWWVLNWNEPALAFYGTVGAEPMNEWTVWRLTGDALSRLAGTNT